MFIENLTSYHAVNLGMTRLKDKNFLTNSINLVNIVFIYNDKKLTT